MRVAIIEDEAKLAAALKEGMEQEGYAASAFADAESFESRRSADPFFDLLILDLMLPGKSGLELCRSLRAAGVATPVLVLTALDTVEDKVAALDSGADDFVTKPFSFEEIAARARAMLRRPSALRGATISVAGLMLDVGAQKVFCGGVEVALTLKEFQILRCLMERAGEVVRRAELAHELWGEAGLPVGNVIDVHIRHLREKIDEPFGSRRLRTVRGVGYSIDA